MGCGYDAVQYSTCHLSEAIIQSNKIKEALAKLPALCTPLLYGYEMLRLLISRRTLVLFFSFMYSFSYSPALRRQPFVYLMSPSPDSGEFHAVRTLNLSH